jgi:tRNA threonylcarbamoyladenosine biosynthesis protein TsaE
VGALFLPDEAATLALGRDLALSLPEGWDNPALLLHAGLGSGKTTLARGFVSALPGGQDSEVASPSFNLANVYPTRPQVVHIDLYRLGEGFLDASLDELLEASPGQGGRILLVEWAEYLPVSLCPGDWLQVDLAQSGQGREAALQPHGPQAAAWSERTLSTYLQSDKS